MNRARNSLLAAASLVALVLGATSSLADCPAMLADFHNAVADKSIDRALDIEKQINMDLVCHAKDKQVRGEILGLAEEVADDPATPTKAREDSVAIVVDWGRSWEDALKLADGVFTLRDFSDAATLYDNAIYLAGDPSAFSDAQKGLVQQRASAAKMLASDDDQGRKAGVFKRSLRGADGAVLGIYSRSLRGAVPVAVPLPINFVFDSTDFTPVGEKAAAEFLDFLKHSPDVTELTLVGHTDPRGPDPYNLDLSKRRLIRFAEFLGKNGVSIKLHLIPKGKSEPFNTDVLPYKPSQEEIWALDRRVELLR